jgi:hypothetical protein
VTPYRDSWKGVEALIQKIGGRFSEDLDSGFESMNGSDIQIHLEVTCRRKGLERSGPLVDVLANSLRHVTSDTVKMIFEDGTVLKGSALKTRKKIRGGLFRQHASAHASGR